MYLWKWECYDTQMPQCIQGYLLIYNVHLEYSSRVIGEHPTVKEELRQSQINHTVVLPDDRLHSVVHQCDILIRQVKEHPLSTTTKKLCWYWFTSCLTLLFNVSESDPEMHVKAPGWHHWIINQGIINPDKLIHLCPHRDGLQHGVNMNQSSMIQGRADLTNRDKSVNFSFI